MLSESLFSWKTSRLPERPLVPLFSLPTPHNTFSHTFSYILNSGFSLAPLSHCTSCVPSAIHWATSSSSACRSLPPGGLPGLLSLMKVPVMEPSPSPQPCLSQPSGDSAIPACLTDPSGRPVRAGTCVSCSPLCPSGHHTSCQEWERTEAICVHWHSLIWCLSHMAF